MRYNKTSGRYIGASGTSLSGAVQGIPEAAPAVGILRPHGATEMLIRRVA